MPAYPGDEAERRDGSPLIGHKTRPPAVPDALVERDRITRALQRMIETQRVSVVLATAGAGKTTAVAQTLARVRMPVAWLSVDRSDQQPGRLLAYVESALERATPAARGVATRALRAGIPHSESAGLLAESLTGTPLVLVLDDLDRLGTGESSWEPLASLLRHLPDSVHVVLIGRRDLPASVLREIDPAHVGVLSESEMAFTVDEADAALRLFDPARADAAETVAATGGWVMGVMFEAWRAGSRGQLGGPQGSAGGEPDQLNSYIATRLLDELPPATREFLITTSLLDEVTADRAAVLGIADPAEHLNVLSSVRLPVVWTDEGRTLRAHPRLREFLLELMDRRYGDEVRAIRLAYADLLSQEGQDEEAADDYLAAGAVDEARRSAARAIRRVIERIDLPTAERWLQLFDELPDEPPEIIEARLMLAWLRDDYRRGSLIGDDLRDRGARSEFARVSERGTALMIICYAQCGRLDDIEDLLAVAAPGAEIDAVRYSLGIIRPSYRAGGPPELTGGPFDAIVLFAKYWYGVLEESEVGETPPWREPLVQAWQIGALRALGQTARALELYERARTQTPDSLSLRVVTPDLLFDAGRIDEAFEAAETGRRMARDAGARVWFIGFTLGLVTLRVRDGRDHQQSSDLLDVVEADPLTRRVAQMDAQARKLRGWLSLRARDDARALEHLREAVRVMQEGHLFLELPVAASLLAEAEWRADNMDRADAAAELAMSAAVAQGSYHVLLNVLGEFPDVLSRRLDALSESDTAWHHVGRALAAHSGAVEVVERPPSVEVRELGAHALVIDGAERKLRLRKSLELLSYLAPRPGASAERARVLDALFERDGQSARSYLRQSVHQLNAVLPAHLQVRTTRTAIELPSELAAACQSVTYEAELSEVALLDGDRAIDAIESILHRNSRQFLPACTSAWVHERREHLSRQLADAVLSTAEVALSIHRYLDAIRLSGIATDIDPLRESAWRLRMRASHALGDSDDLLSSFEQCEKALAAIDVEPSPATRRLLHQLQT